VVIGTTSIALVVERAGTSYILPTRGSIVGNVTACLITVSCAGVLRELLTGYTRLNRSWITCQSMLATRRWIGLLVNWKWRKNNGQWRWFHGLEPCAIGWFSSVACVSNRHRGALGLPKAAGYLWRLFTVGSKPPSSAGLPAYRNRGFGCHIFLHNSVIY
jgi:hypothetical protein